MKSQLAREAPVFARLITGLAGKRPEEAAEAVLCLASASGLRDTTGFFRRTTPFLARRICAVDPSVQGRFWDERERLVGSDARSSALRTTSCLHASVAAVADPLPFSFRAPKTSSSRALFDDPA